MNKFILRRKGNNLIIIETFLVNKEEEDVNMDEEFKLEEKAPTLSLKIDPTTTTTINP